MVAWGLVAISSIDDFVKPYLISRGSSLPILPCFGHLAALRAPAHRRLPPSKRSIASLGPALGSWCLTWIRLLLAILNFVRSGTRGFVMNNGMHIDNEMRCKVTPRTVAGSLGRGVLACVTMSPLPPPPPPWWWLKPEPPGSGFLFATRAIGAKLHAGAVWRYGLDPDAREQ